jgi:CelD/BcsL family acetyltransferase involved in cellulose biosynthesis
MEGYRRMRLLSLDSLTPGELRAWEQVADEAVEPNPFFEPEFVRPAASALGAGDVLLLIDEGEDGRWRGCMPVAPTRALGRTLLLATWKHPYSFLGTPLVASDSVEAFAEALVGSMRRRAPSRFLMLRRAGEGPVLAALRSAVEAEAGLTAIFERRMERAALDRRPEPDYFGQLKAKRRSELRRLRRKLGEELGGEPESREHADVGAAADRFLELEASGWKGEAGTAMASDATSARLFRDVCDGLASKGRLRFRSLEVGERVTAMTCDIAAGDVLFGFKTAYDEGLRRYSPGVQLLLDNFLAFHEHGAERTIDSCGEPGNEAMAALWPDRRRIATIAFGSRGPYGRLLGKALERSFDSRTREAAETG